MITVDGWMAIGFTVAIGLGLFFLARARSPVPTEGDKERFKRDVAKPTRNATTEEIGDNDSESDHMSTSTADPLDVVRAAGSEGDLGGGVEFFGGDAGGD